MENRIAELERQLKETGERLSSTTEQLRLQSRRARQLVAACSAKVDEKEREMRMLRNLKDGQLQSIVRQLLHFESRLRQEQLRIEEIVRQKDQVIRNQATELDQLRLANRKLLISAQHNEEEEEDSSADSKMPKMDHHHRFEDKENNNKQSETPLVTKMVRRFELPAAHPVAALVQQQPKPQVPKKPARFAANTSPTTTKGIVRTDSVNDHGYFTLEKQRKPIRMSVASESEAESSSNSSSPLDLPREDFVMLGDETDLRQNFEEFHLMDSLEEEEQQLLFQESSQTLRTPDRSSGDGAERTTTSSMMATTPPPAERSTSLSTMMTPSGSQLQIIPQIGDATPISGVQFDRFLDVTGLTQKSILTPSRLLSNHKNMLKPKDIKHRHMINKQHLLLHHPGGANSMSNCRSSNGNDPTKHSANHVRYYVEPFL